MSSRPAVSDRSEQRSRWRFRPWLSPSALRHSICDAANGSEFNAYPMLSLRSGCFLPVHPEAALGGGVGPGLSRALTTEFTAVPDQCMMRSSIRIFVPGISGLIAIAFVRRKRVDDMVDADPVTATAIPVVGIGASVGGIEALGSFFDAMSTDSGCMQRQSASAEVSRPAGPRLFKRSSQEPTTHLRVLVTKGTGPGTPLWHIDIN
ncbi:hypothetical protein SAMN05216228_1010174 [Rhizobium tibeticum]|uniref:Uncharacterized protein n=1 Tax=Rhizobium tibeticum TaxID=501024 RepID=A0A1H8L9G3_9HYPH|nr:hypothetical protein RTCCBAU85039_2816 [Rhizobium tibeticum]SEO01775.1 hypothetical protein SAMN05216228_1010174 [Rhizobium tibeticum]